MRFLRVTSLVAYALASSAAYGADVNGYAVGNHRACGASNLPGTIAELDKFFASEHFPDDARKNFLWSDLRVRMDEWHAGRDIFVSSETVNGFDGADSALLSYIASHGVTSAGKYTALAGGAQNACYIRSSEMAIGDHRARYLILSTCQGLKIGTGQDPTLPGEDPSVTWATANQGLNCMFGYSNDMVDADTYGVHFLEGLATTDETLVDAFFRASRRVSMANIPAALCFGTDDGAARQSLETARRFSEERYGKGGSAWTYDRARRLDRAFELPNGVGSTVIPRVVKTAPRRFAAGKLARRLLGDDAKESALADGLKLFKADSGSMTYNPNTGLVSWRKGGTSLARRMTVRDATAVKVARDFLTRRGLVGDAAADLVATYITDRGAQVEGQAATVAKIVTFHQRVQGLTPLGAAGSVEVTVDAEGRVTALTAALLDVETPRVAEWLDVGTKGLQSHRDIARRRLAYRLAGANISVLDARVGYDVGDYSAVPERSRVMVEVLLEAEGGGFARRYIEKVPL